MQNKNLLDILKDSSCSKHVAFTQFSLSYKPTKNSVLYCFFEGAEDKRYYGTRIKLITERSYECFTCQGKDGVKGVMSLITKKKEYELASTLYFIDKDYSNDATNGDLYVTPCYSIENLYSTKQVISNILTNEFNLNVTDNDYVTAIKLFDDLQHKFHQELSYINSWLACQHDLRERTSSSTRLKIDQCLKEYFKKIIKEDLVTLNDFSDLKDKSIIESQLFQGSQQIAEEDMEKKDIFFDTHDKQKVFRGKFELNFIVNFLNRLKNDICSKSPNYFTERRKCTLRFELANAISVLSQYADTPSCLKDYLGNYKKV